MVSRNLPNRPSHYEMAEMFFEAFNRTSGNAPLRWCNDEWHYGTEPWLECVVRADLWRYLDRKEWRPTVRTIDSVLDALRAVSVNSEIDSEFPA